MSGPKVVWSRRSVLGNGAMLAGAGAVFAAGVASGSAAAQGAKVAPALAHYQPSPKGKAACDTCTSFLAPSACKVVTGEIAPTGWCTLYAAKH